MSITKQQQSIEINNEAKQFVKKLIKQTENVIDTENLNSITKRFYTLSAERGSELAKHYKLKFNIPEKQTFDVWYDFYNDYLFDEMHKKMNA